MHKIDCFHKTDIFIYTRGRSREKEKTGRMDYNIKGTYILHIGPRPGGHKILAIYASVWLDALLVTLYIEGPN